MPRSYLVSESGSDSMTRRGIPSSVKHDSHWQGARRCKGLGRKTRAGKGIGIRGVSLTAVSSAVAQEVTGTLPHPIKDWLGNVHIIITTHEPAACCPCSIRDVVTHRFVFHKPESIYVFWSRSEEHLACRRQNSYKSPFIANVVRIAD